MSFSTESSSIPFPPHSLPAAHSPASPSTGFNSPSGVFFPESPVWSTSPTTSSSETFLTQLPPSNIPSPPPSDEFDFPMTMSCGHRNNYRSIPQDSEPIVYTRPDNGRHYMPYFCLPCDTGEVHKALAYCREGATHGSAMYKHKWFNLHAGVLEDFRRRWNKTYDDPPYWEIVEQAAAITESARAADLLAQRRLLLAQSQFRARRQIQAQSQNQNPFIMPPRPAAPPTRLPTIIEQPEDYRRRYTYTILELLAMDTQPQPQAELELQPEPEPQPRSSCVLRLRAQRCSSEPAPFSPMLFEPEPCQPGQYFLVRVPGGAGRPRVEWRRDMTYSEEWYLETLSVD